VCEIAGFEASDSEERKMRIGLALLALVPFSAAIIGCSAPCDRMCDAQADYVAACVDYTADAISKGLTPPAGWDIYETPSDWWTEAYGVSGAEDFAAACKEDAEAVLADLEGDDRGLMEQECEDEAMVLENYVVTEVPDCHAAP
jgi:hypothetical protein